MQEATEHRNAGARRGYNPGEGARRAAAGGGRRAATLVEFNGVSGLRVTRLAEADDGEGHADRDRCMGIVCEPMS